MIALHFPVRMYRPQSESSSFVVIQVRGGGGGDHIGEGATTGSGLIDHHHQQQQQQVPIATSTRFAPKNKFSTLSSMKLFDRFRKILMRFVFSIPPRTSSSTIPRHRHGDRPEPPKTSCSSYHYSPNSHYTEAIADCIEFFNKSSQEGSSDHGRKSDDVLV